MIHPDEIDGSFSPRPRSGVAAVELDGEAVLYDEATGRTNLLNPTATAVWFCFDGSGTIDEVVADVAAAFGASVHQVRQDVLGLARELGRQGFLEGLAVEGPT